MACLFVLFEDLRIEIAGQTASDLGGLDECGADARTLYFLRRSIATLHEFATELRALDRLPSFHLIRARFDFTAETHWKRAINYFQKYNK